MGLPHSDRKPPGGQSPAYAGLDLVLAELEIPYVDFQVVFPPWLASHVVREVTDEPAYRNVAIAVQAPAV